MAIRSDSYSSTTEVLTFTRHLLDGQSTFNSTTRPTLTEVEKLIDRASGQLNVALYSAGFTAPVSNATAKLACDDWVTDQVVSAVEQTRMGLAGFGELEEERPRVFRGLAGKARRFVQDHELAFNIMGVKVGYAKSTGLVFTGEKAVDERADPDDSSLKQPRFHAEMFIKENET